MRSILRCVDNYELERLSNSLRRIELSSSIIQGKIETFESAPKDLVKWEPASVTRGDAFIETTIPRGGMASSTASIPSAGLSGLEHRSYLQTAIARMKAEGTPSSDEKAIADLPLPADFALWNRLQQQASSSSSPRSSKSDAASASTSILMETARNFKTSSSSRGSGSSNTSSEHTAPRTATSNSGCIGSSSGCSGSSSSIVVGSRRRANSDLNTVLRKPKRARSSSLGDWATPTAKRTVVDLVAALNESFPDYDFGHTKPNQFTLRSTADVLRIVNSYLAELTLQNPSFLAKLWSAIDDFVNLDRCDVFAYIPDATDDVLFFNVWSFNYFFFNKDLKRICYFTCSAQSKLRRYHNGLVGLPHIAEEEGGRGGGGGAGGYMGAVVGTEVSVGMGVGDERYDAGLSDDEERQYDEFGLEVEAFDDPAPESPHQNPNPHTIRPIFGSGFHSQQEVDEEEEEEDLGSGRVSGSGNIISSWGVDAQGPLRERDGGSLLWGSQLTVDDLDGQEEEGEEEEEEEEGFMLGGGSQVEDDDDAANDVPDWDGII